MSVAVPKHRVKEPIGSDVIIVCRKLSFIELLIKVLKSLFTDSNKEAEELVKRFNNTGKKLSRNDTKVISMARLITTLSRVKEREMILDYLNSNEANIDRLVEVIWNHQAAEKSEPRESQLLLF